MKQENWSSVVYRSTKTKNWDLDIESWTPVVVMLSGGVWKTFWHMVGVPWYSTEQRRDWSRIQKTRNQNTNNTCESVSSVIRNSPDEDFLICMDNNLILQNTEGWYWQRKSKSIVKAATRNNGCFFYRLVLSRHLRSTNDRVFNSRPRFGFQDQVWVC